MTTLPTQFILFCQILIHPEMIVSQEIFQTAGNPLQNVPLSLGCIVITAAPRNFSIQTSLLLRERWWSYPNGFC
jgi:hypothetical protein